MSELIITEKPKSAQRIAQSLSEGTLKKETYKKKVPYYILHRGGKEIIVASAVGHLFGLAEKNRNKWTYPVFDVEWKPIYEISRFAGFSKNYLDLLKKLSKEADTFTISTDLDPEGEVIGYNIVRFVCKQKDARRMKFSTLTKPDLVNAYEKVSPTLEWGQANAGLTRHELDWYWGINTSRALTSSIKTAGMFKILSAGRVQGPALKILVEREKEIGAFKPKPFWQVEFFGEAKKGKINALHEKDKFWKEKEAKEVVKKTKGKKGVVKEIKKEEVKQYAPFPFDLTTLQTEAYRCLRVSPKNTLSIAQELYTSGLISYPRTSSQKLPPIIGYKKIINMLAKQKEYGVLCSELLLISLKPNDGKKTDPAHPAIYPTGIMPKALEKGERAVYDLIVKRFLATFADIAVKESINVKIDVNGETFIARGLTTKITGWHVFYEPYVKQREEELPKLEKDEEIKNKRIDLKKKETQPPKRYTPASIIRELEKRNLGTKATRSEIIDTLFQRGYLEGAAIEATGLGIKTVETLEKYCPRILDEELTRHFEEEMEEIRKGKKKNEDVLNEAQNVLTKILKDFKKKEKEIGKGLITATKEMHQKASTVGICPECKKGTLMIKKGKYGRFIACSRYPECKTTYNLPDKGLIKVTDKICKACKHPMISMIRKGRRPQLVCINRNCPTKKITEKIEKKRCPKCNKGFLVLRKSIYGSFLACDEYPKCRYTEKLNNNKN